MPLLPADRVLRDGDWGLEQRPAPLALTRRSGSSLLIAHVDVEAAQLGLRPGLTVGQAHALVPELTLRPHDPAADRAALYRLSAWAIRFSPLVEPVEPDTLLIDVTGCQRLFHGEENLAQQAAEGLRRQGFHARAAIADTVGAACALAVAGPEAVTIAPPGQTAAYLAPLPSSALRIAPDVAARLDTLGLRTIGDLLKLPRASLPARFGSALVLRLQQALGEVFEGLAAVEPQPHPHTRLRFDEPLHEWPHLRPAAEQLLDELFTQLAARDRAIRRLDVTLCFERTPPLSLSVGLSRASRSAEHVGTLLDQRLERVDLSPGVSGLMLVARETSPWRAPQADLFTPQTAGDEERLGCLVDRLVARLGPAAVVRPELLDDHQPECAFRYVSVADVGCAPSKPAQRPATLTTLPRPLQLLSRPVPIRVIALVPDGPPTWLAWQGREYVVAAAAGPERLETAWWRGPDVRRDYFRVTAETGEQFWIFHAGDDRRWYLHGIFA
jgi:protein ImuB